MRAILVVDDEEALRRAFCRQLASFGYASDGVGTADDARSALRERNYAIALLDINLPGESGLDLLAHVRSRHSGTGVVMVTGSDDPELARRAIESGAYGYLIKPVRATELLINIANAFHRRELESQHRIAVERLQAVVEQRTEDLVTALANLRQAGDLVQSSQEETVLRLARLVEVRDEATGHHIDRMSQISAVVGARLGLPPAACKLLQLASQLHDVGKIGVPDSILLKPGILTPDEYEIMKSHAAAGHRMLADSQSQLLRLAATVAWTHHERWDGSGYPRGLTGQSIPIEGRIAAVADVYDALTSRRVYRAAFASQTAVDMMEAERGRHFDPQVLDAFRRAAPEIDHLHLTYPHVNGFK